MEPPALPGELVEEILLRLPPDDPSCLLRASLVCKPWGRSVSDPYFRRRLHALHGTPPVLGFLHNLWGEDTPRFVRTTASPFSLAAPDRQPWRAIGCRHGRALFISMAEKPLVLLVWEPMTGARKRVPLPAVYKSRYPSGAVVCAADGCDHRGCHGGPFRVVFVSPEDDARMSLCVYSSKSDAWGELNSVNLPAATFDGESSMLAGASLLYFLSDCRDIVEYDLAGGGIALLHAPDPEISAYVAGVLMLTADGGLGFADSLPQSSSIRLWAKDASDAAWVNTRVINLDSVPTLSLPSECVLIMGFAEGANVLFVGTDAGIFTINLQSNRVAKVCQESRFYPVYPIVSFYTPRPAPVIEY